MAQSAEMALSDMYFPHLEISLLSLFLGLGIKLPVFKFPAFRFISNRSPLRLSHPYLWDLTILVEFPPVFFIFILLFDTNWVIRDSSRRGVTMIAQPR